MTADLLTPELAADIAGVPAHQLRTWAYDKVGPKNVGTRHRPLYRAEDVEVWKRARRNQSLMDNHEKTFAIMRGEK